MYLPAVCDNCGSIFEQRAIRIQNSRGVSFTNVGVGPCPLCGGMGHIPDGVYDVVGNVIGVVSAPHHARGELERIAQIFRQAKERKESAEEIAANIRRDAPSLSGLADLLPQNRVDVYAFIQIVLAVLALYLTVKTSSPNITINQVINHITVEASKTSAQGKEQAPKTVQGKAPKADKAKKYRKEKRRVKKGKRR